MKLLSLVVIMSAFFSQQLIAAEVASDKQENKDFCTYIYDAANQIMSARQSGVPMPKLMQIIRKSGGQKIDEDMVTEAYEVSRFSTEEYAKRAISDFSDAWYLLCIKANKK